LMYINPFTGMEQKQDCFRRQAGASRMFTGNLVSTPIYNLN